MTVKTYLSSTVEAAVALARHELGPDAMLMSSRPAAPDVLHLGRYEVVFAAAAVLEKPLHQVLASNDVAPHLISEIRDQAHMESMIPAATALGDSVASVGPPGRGKTSTILKLAVKYGLAVNRPVRILSADSRRFGSFAATLGLAFECFESISDLDAALSAPSNALTLIDTSRYSPLDGGLARCLLSHHVDTHLVLRSDTTTALMLRTVAQYRTFEPSHLIFTGLDEIESFGNLFSVAVETQLPVSFLAAGQRIPGDLEAATPARMVHLVFHPAHQLSRAA